MGVAMEVHPLNVTNDFDDLIIPLPLSNHAVHFKQIPSCSDDHDSDTVNYTLAGSDLCNPSSDRRIMPATVRNHPGTMYDLIFSPLAKCLIVAGKMQEGSSQDVDGATDLSKLNCRFLDEYEHTGRACVENIGNTTSESPRDSSGTCENSSNSGYLVMNDQSHATLPDLRYFRNMDYDEPYTCREILKKHLRTKQLGQFDTSTPSGTITPEVAPSHPKCYCKRKCFLPHCFER
ncbi:hypothetical protein GJ496_004755 [Pomphorhynchus laevis]|nr:hypothetical protein GJ496_004755 [Pomphorhynchus laevis]